MQFFEDTPFGGKDFSMSRIIEQLGQGLLGEMQQRRQRLNQQSVLRGLSPDLPENQVINQSYADPGTFQAMVKEMLKGPMYEASSNITSQMVNEGQGQGQSQQQEQPRTQQDLVSALGDPGATLPTGGMGTQPAAAPQLPSTQASNKFDEGPKGLGRQIRIPKKITPQMASLIQKENADYRKIYEKRRDRAVKVSELLNKKFEEASKDETEKRLLISNIRNIKRYWESGQVIDGATQQFLQASGLDKLVTNAPTQAAIKGMWDVITDKYSSMKNIRGSNLVANMISKTKPSELNTKEGAIPVLDTMESLATFGAKLDGLRKEQYKKAEGMDHLPVDIMSGREKDIAKLESDHDRRLEQISTKAIGYTSEATDVDNMDDPTTFNTMSDGIMFRKDGKLYGSDGKKIREAVAVLDENGNPIKFIRFADEESEQ